ncbi:cde6e57e-09c4-47ec-9da4-b85cad913717 [Sclerotinia trifoliorum]|uniref:Cde6e57e-09c4-47ec-9da4-b85cad913717 n=1 Tax=Sclerotinia trifoliorum TaxID=28548 RepID=A0A8H2ZPA5_9HELO|nr:cde6e57e-09c4-47ec-9da4-b85cad913717 [Sclerotinia trifoliorum]
MTSPSPTFLLETQAIIPISPRTDRREQTGRHAQTIRHADDVYLKGAKRMLDLSGSRPQIYVDIIAKELYFRELAFIESADGKLYVALPQELVKNTDFCGRNGWQKREEKKKTLENRLQEAPQGFKYVKVPDYCTWYEELKKKEKERDCVVSFVVVEGTVEQKPAQVFQIAELEKRVIHNPAARVIWYHHRGVWAWQGLDMRTW